MLCPGDQLFSSDTHATQIIGNVTVKDEKICYDETYTVKITLQICNIVGRVS